MRFIDQELLEPRIRPLLASLAAARTLVDAETDPKRRAELINSMRARWVAFRTEFDRFSDGKCWYVECRNPGTDDDIDHFRPKLAVAEDDEHPGYFWLAFDWRNLRLSCHRANRPRRAPSAASAGGKGEHFPLFDPANRAMGPGDDIGLEIPNLLDPTNPLDPPLLTFKPNGEADLAPAFAGNALAEAKWDASRTYLHLNWPAFVDARIDLYNRIAQLVERGARESPATDPNRLQASAAFLDAIRDLVRMMAASAEYSAAARAYIQSFRHVWWVDNIVLALS
jgi:hypothetical protein